MKPICSLANHTQPINSVRFSPDGSLLASGGARGELLLWRPEAASGDIQAPGNLQAAEGDAECWKYTSALRGHNEDVNDLAWSPDGTALLSGSVEGIALLWDVKSRKGRSRLEDHKGYVQVPEPPLLSWFLDAYDAHLSHVHVAGCCMGSPWGDLGDAGCR